MTQGCDVCDRMGSVSYSKPLLKVFPLPNAQVTALILTHSHEGDDFIHVRPDMALHKGHQHSQLLEQELKDTEFSEVARPYTSLKLI